MQPPENKADGEMILESGAELRQADRDRLLCTWHGCAHYHICCKGKKIIVDPLYHRPAGAKPHLPLTREDVDHLDYLLLTHAHLDHSWDFPFLASRDRPEAYGPKEYLAYIQTKANRWGLKFDRARLHGLEPLRNDSTDGWHQTREYGTADYL